MKLCSTIKLKHNKLSNGILKKIKDTILAGGVIIFPTDTVYGIGCYPFNFGSVKKIYKIKKRSDRKPLILLCSNFKQVLPFIKYNVNDKLLGTLISKFWPGALTIIFECSPLGQVLTHGRTTVGVRIPKHKVLLQMLDNLCVPIVTTSANISKKENICDGDKAAKLFKDKVDFIINTGKTEHKKVSTVLDVTSFPYTVIREGCIKKNKIYEVLNKCKKKI